MKLNHSVDQLSLFLKSKILTSFVKAKDIFILCLYSLKALLHYAIFSATCLAMVENLALQVAEVWY